MEARLSFVNLGVADLERATPFYARRARAAAGLTLAHVAAHGGRIVKSGGKAEWGGYTGYSADSDGFLWEVVWNPHFPHV